jgi:CrcB protein
MGVDWLKLTLIAAAGGVGSVLRYGVAVGAAWLFGAGFPYGTLTVNVVGSLLLGFLAAALVGGPVVVDERLRMALLVGLLGGFTTFSTFAFETTRYLEDGQWGLAVGNIMLNNALALAAALAGWRLAQKLYGVAG